MLPDMGQMEKERRESHEWALCYDCLHKFLAELYPVASILLQIIFSPLISISNPADWITKINKCILEKLFLFHFSYQPSNSALL